MEDTAPEPPIARDTLPTQVANRIMDEIITRRIPPGAEIAPEGELARRFGVNRLVVREAVRSLVAREILVASQGRPARVRTPSAQVLGQMLQFRLRHQSLGFEDVLKTRRVIEIELVKEAAIRVGAGKASCAKARELLRAMKTAPQRDHFISLDIDFHAEIARMAGSEILALFLESLEITLLEFRRMSYDGRSARHLDQLDTVDAHARILDAIAASDADLAASCMGDHLATSAADIEAYALASIDATNRADGGGGADTTAKDEVAASWAPLAE
jgi:DNA-binding FadR family transcriptional regulator